MIRKQVGDLSTHTTKYTSLALTQKVFANIRRVEVNAGDVAEGDVSIAHGEVPTVAKEPSISSPTPPTPPLQPSQDIPATSQAQPTPPQSPQGKMIIEVDVDVDVVLEDDKEVADEAKREDETEPVEVQEVVDVVTTAKLITEVVTAASETITAASTNITAAEAQVPAITLTAAPARVTAAPNRRRKGVDKGKGILVEEPKPLKKKQQIKKDEKFARELEVELNKNIDWDEVIDHVKIKAKEDPAVRKYQALKRKPQTKAQSRKNMMLYLKNVAGFKMGYFKGMSYDDIRPIFEAKFNSNVAFLLKTKEQIEEEKSRALKRLNETPAEKAAKRRKLDEESLVKERFSTTKPKNFSNDFLIVTLRAIFDKSDIHAQIWKNQRSVHGQAKVKGWKLLESCGVQIITFTTTQLILLVERKYPLTRFTLDQMLNAVRLEVEEESEVSLELLSLIAEVDADADADVVLEDDKEVADEAKEVADEAKDKGKGILLEEPKPLKKKQQIEQDEKFARELEAELNKNIDWDEVIDHVKIKAKEDHAVKKYQALKRKPQTEAQARKNMMLYLKNVVGFKMDYFKGMSYDDIRPIFKAKFNSSVAFLLKIKEQIEEEESRALKRLNETPAKKAAKWRKLDEEVEELKRHLQIVPNEDDDVYTEATSLAQKVPVVDYQIIELNNKPYYKIIRAADTHQLYVSFLSLLRNFDREDLKALWSLVKERFSIIKPKNFFDDFLLVTLGAMFKKPDIHAQIWKNQRSVHGQAKVKGWKLLESCGVQIITFTARQLIL
uniref:Uncharacterized protein n=1 Tax=Tanacetum cinerariifolium TaxID=118510 RepID=A0A699IBY2_TANCI|nr:hypothetical protein [Tanacetum cinerariifolium]